MSYVRRPQITAPSWGDLALEHLLAGLVLEGPIVETLPVVAEPGLEPDVGPGDEAVERCALVVDHAAHADTSLEKESRFVGRRATA